MVTYKVFKSDYSFNVLRLVQDLFIMGKKCGHIKDIKIYENFYEVTSHEFLYKHFQNLINK